jgi:hypothetical protein
LVISSDEEESFKPSSRKSAVVFSPSPPRRLKRVRRRVSLERDMHEEDDDVDQDAEYDSMDDFVVDDGDEIPEEALQEFPAEFRRQMDIQDAMNILIDHFKGETPDSVELYKAMTLLERRAQDALSTLHSRDWSAEFLSNVQKHVRLKSRNIDRLWAGLGFSTPQNSINLFRCRFISEFSFEHFRKCAYVFILQKFQCLNLLFKLVNFCL